MTLIWSPKSIEDLIALRAQIAEHDPAAAKRVALHILRCVEELLAEHPKLGRAGPRSRHPRVGDTENTLHRSVSRARRSYSRLPASTVSARRWPDRV